MKILSQFQIKNLDENTILSEPISAINLMERAGRKLAGEIINLIPDPRQPFHIFCGNGNNGGDGLVVARMLIMDHRIVYLYVPKREQCSPDMITNFERLPTRGYMKVIEIDSDFDIPREGIVIDAIFGTGMNRPVESPFSELISRINDLDLTTISIDVPSGMQIDKITVGNCIRANYTLTLQTPKLAFYQPENAPFLGKISILDIQLDAATLKSTHSPNHLLTRSLISSYIPIRSTFDHKGTFGHALLVCGGYGKVGAAILASMACLRVGAGKLTVHVPRSAYQILQLGVPEAMVSVDDHDYYFTECVDLHPYAAIGIGCGIGTKCTTQSGLHEMLKHTTSPLVIDADALNILALHPGFLSDIPEESILTPHPGEYKRLFGDSVDSFRRLEEQRTLSQKLRIYIVYKNAHTCITTPEGEAYFNDTGNPGMATAGSGDVLTGMITGLLAQGIPTKEAVLSAVYLHGFAGDIAAEQMGQQALLARDIVDNIGKAIGKTQMLSS